MSDKQARLLRMEQLKKRVKIENPLGSLYSECIEALGPNTRIYSLKKVVRDCIYDGEYS